MAGAILFTPQLPCRRPESIGRCMACTRPEFDAPGRESAPEEPLQPANSVVDQAARPLVFAIPPAERLPRARLEGAADDTRDEHRIGPWPEIREATGDAERHLDTLLGVRRPPCVLHP